MFQSHTWRLSVANENSWNNVVVEHRMKSIKDDDKFIKELNICTALESICRLFQSIFDDYNVSWVLHSFQSPNRPSKATPRLQMLNSLMNLTSSFILFIRCSTTTLSHEFSLATLSLEVWLWNIGSLCFPYLDDKAPKTGGGGESP